MGRSLQWSTPGANAKRRRQCRFEPLESRVLLAADLAVQPTAGDAAISGRVYHASAEGEAGIPAVELQLLDAVGQVVRVARTDAHGQYAFAGLIPGLYAVQQTQPTGFADGPERVGAAGGQVLTNDLLGEIPLAAGQAAAGYDFAEYAPADAPTPSADGLPRLILAGGGISGTPALRSSVIATLRAGTPASPPAFDLSVPPTAASRDVAIQPLATAAAAEEDEAVPGAHADARESAASALELVDDELASWDDWDAAHAELGGEEGDLPDAEAESTDAVDPLAALLRSSPATRTPAEPRAPVTVQPQRQAETARADEAPAAPVAQQSTPPRRDESAA